MKMDGYKEEFEESLKQAFLTESEKIKADDTLKTRIDFQIENRQEEFKMKTRKQLKIKKLAIVAACACLLLPTGIFAAGKITAYVTSSNPMDYKKSGKWSDLSAIEKKVGISADVLKEFSNGYAFSEMEASAYNGLDGENNKVSKTKQMTLIYENSSGAAVDLFIANKKEGLEEDGKEERQADEIQKYNGVSVKYFRDTYKSEPADYKETPEDQELMKQGNYFISYGAGEEEIQTLSSVTWEKDGLSYAMMAFDTELTPQQMMDMAGELIQK